MNTTSTIPFFKLLFVIVLLPILLFGCKSDDTIYDASGTFEATEIIVSAQANGVIKALNLSQGQTLDSGKQVGYIDTTQLFLKSKQL